MLFVILNKSDAKLQLFFGLWCRMKGKIIKNFCEGRSHHRKVNMPQQKAGVMAWEVNLSHKKAGSPGEPETLSGNGAGSPAYLTTTFCPLWI
jgi:hypothetical protein